MVHDGLPAVHRRITGHCISFPMGNRTRVAHAESGCRRGPGLVALILALCPACGAAQEAGLAAKYQGAHNILRGGPELLRLNAIYAPLPGYPSPLLLAGKHGLVVIEVAVSAAGRVVDSRILETFDNLAAKEVISKLKAWRFHTEQEMIAARIIVQCRDCVRINRLAFDFRIEQGKGTVVDLADEEIRQRHMADPFKSN